MPNRHLPDQTRLVGRDVLFIPEIAWRSDLTPPKFSRDGFATTLVIDLQRLTQAPATAGTVATPPAAAAPTQARPAGEAGAAGATDASAPPASELQTIKEDMKKKESELEELRKELGAIRRQIDQQAEQPGKPAVPPAKKPVK
jgi:hypothetical protein